MTTEYEIIRRPNPQSSFDDMFVRDKITGREKRVGVGNWNGAKARKASAFIAQLRAAEAEYRVQMDLSWERWGIEARQKLAEYDAKKALEH